ncbi:ArsR/SmtB family transcription factor [Alteribacter keqinensis]|uniref:Transcriptional regulator n=1 Tax=Alteribacter keqinensis TaxID=2483800 RepID=A0A3M7TMA5_9BACI|nr:metalloregulator ArsR/SmtB family transcription factor [Alteribacter keqinensis]RNA66320.1 transcriptional regulator [Alteribacter keqinensis]
MKTTETCEVYTYDQAKVDALKKQINETDVQATSQIFKVLADEKRFTVAYALTLTEELCVCDIANLLGASTATASHHLRTLHKKGLVKSRKEGKLVFYSLDDDHVTDVINLAMLHQREGKGHE